MPRKTLPIFVSGTHYLLAINLAEPLKSLYDDIFENVGVSLHMQDLAIFN